MIRAILRTAAAPLAAAVPWVAAPVGSLAILAATAAIMGFMLWGGCYVIRLFLQHLTTISSAPRRLTSRSGRICPDLISPTGNHHHQKWFGRFTPLRRECRQQLVNAPYSCPLRLLCLLLQYGTVCALDVGASHLNYRTTTAGLAPYGPVFGARDIDVRSTAKRCATYASTRATNASHWAIHYGLYALA